MKKFSRKLVLSFFSVILVLITLTASTFAWLSLAMTNYVDNLHFMVSNGGEFKMTIGDPKKKSIQEFTNWSESINVEDYLSYVNLANVTSRNGRDFQNRSGTKADYNAYVEIPLYFKVENVPESYGVFKHVGIYLGDYLENPSYDEAVNGTLNGSYIVSRGVTKTAGYEYRNRYGEIVSPGTNGIYYAHDAMRISVCPVEFDNINTMHLDRDYVSEGKIIDLSKEPQYGYANKADEMYQTPRGAISYEMVEETYDIETVDIPETAPVTYGYADDGEQPILLELTEVIEGDQKVYYGKCYVYVWLEGWDVDCYDVVLKDIIYVGLNFRVKQY